MTTGHEWNGIKELNTPVPRVVYFFLIVTALFSVGYWVLMPAWPLGLTYTKGLLGIDQRTTVAESLEGAALDRKRWTKRIENESYQAIQADPALMTIVRQTGRTLFGDNCAACHGLDAKGGNGFPEPHDGVLAVGRRPGNHRRDHPRRHQLAASEHADCRRCWPSAATGCCQPADVDNVVAYVRSLSDPAAAKRIPPAKLDAGKAIFAANCAACHGDDAKGKSDVGAPNLTDKFWIYGGDAQSILTTRVERAAGPHADMGRPPERRSIARSSRSISSI